MPSFLYFQFTKHRNRLYELLLELSSQDLLTIESVQHSSSWPYSDATDSMPGPEVSLTSTLCQETAS